MLKIEKTVFISYRRTNIYHARAIFQDLRANGYDVFLDYENIDSGAFDQIILNQIRARAHFIIILTPSALERCTDPNDWLRREIETAIDEKRNIIPLMFDGFNWNNMRQHLVGKMTILDTYNALDIPANYFDEAMNRLRTRFLNIPIDAVLHPTPKADESAVARKIADIPYSPTLNTKLLHASEYFERAYQHGEAKNYDMAIADYTEAIRLNPQNAIAYNNRGNAYMNGKKDYDRAIVDYTEAIRLNPQDADAYDNRGIAYQNKKDYDQAIEDHTEAIRLNPHNPTAYYRRGIAYANKGDTERAIADYDQAIRLNPQHAKAYVNRGIAYRNKGEYDRAIADYTEAIRLNPQFAIAYNNRGYVYNDFKKMYDVAISDFNEAIRLNPQFADAYNNRGNAYQNGKKEYDRAIADYTEAIRLNPQYAKAYVNRGLAYRKKGDYDRAIADFDRALQINPNHENARNNRKLALRKKRGG